MTFAGKARVAGGLALAVACFGAAGRAEDAVTVERDGERRDLRSDHIAFHRFVEGIKQQIRVAQIKAAISANREFEIKVDRTV